MSMIVRQSDEKSADTKSEPTRGTVIHTAEMVATTGETTRKMIFSVRSSE